jgi:site-specific DNA-methyltransferase (adenine-specific)
MFFETIDQEYLWQFFLECDRVLRLDGHLYMFCDHNVNPILCNWIREVQGEHRFGECHPIVWDKINMGMGYHYRGQYENIVFAWREPREGLATFKKRRLNDLGIADILKCKRVTGGYPTEKPEEIVRTLVNQSVRPFVTNQNDKPEVICDPFAGSGVLGAVAPAHCRVLLNDKSPASIKHIYARLGAPKPQNLFGESHAQNDLESR